MRLLPERVPTTALHDFTALFVPRDAREGTTVELRLIVSATGLSIRDFGVYLSLADRVYGRLSDAGLRSYSHTPDKQLRIDEIRHGSLEIIIKEAISSFPDATPIVILWLFLKYLPTAVKSMSEVAKNTADTFKSFQEGALARENRKRLREDIRKDDTIQQLDPNRINQLVLLLDALQKIENKQLPAPIRFAQEEVKSVEIVVNQKE